MARNSRINQSNPSSASSKDHIQAGLDVIDTTLRKSIRSPLQKCLESLVLAACSSSVSLLSLSPVYGSIPASIYHQRLVLSTVLLGCATRYWYHKILVTGSERWTTYLPIVAVALPPLQSLLFKQSALMGPSYGPSVTELCTYMPVVFLSVVVAATEIDKVGPNRFGHGVRAVGSVLFIVLLFMVFQRVMTAWMIGAFRRSLFLSRAGIQYVIAIMYACKFPSRKLYVWSLLVVLPLSTNLHLASQARTAALNETLLSHGYSLVARNESVTGYISVLDNINEGFRVMRCDHSLLGGEWSRTPRNLVSGLREPIYAIFTMLEAVRLVEPNRTEHSDIKKQALVM